MFHQMKKFQSSPMINNQEISSKYDQKSRAIYTYKDLIHLKSNFESYMVDRNSLGYYMSQTEVK